MSISIGYQKNLDTLCRAVKNGDVCVAECTDKVTQLPVNVICAVSKDKDNMVVMVPLARMFDGNPYEQLDPPRI